MLVRLIVSLVLLAFSRGKDIKGHFKSSIVSTIVSVPFWNPFEL